MLEGWVSFATGFVEDCVFMALFCGVVVFSPLDAFSESYPSALDVIANWRIALAPFCLAAYR